MAARSDPPRVPVELFARVLRTFGAEVFEDRGCYYVQRGAAEYPFKPMGGWLSGSQVNYACEAIGVNVVDFYIAAVKPPDGPEGAN